MKTKEEAQVLRDRDESGTGYMAAAPQNMVRTQIYLTREEHEFLLSEAGRRNEPMAAVIRSFIDEKMRPAENLWEGNSLLAPTVAAPGFEGREDGSLNHDYYAYGGSPKYKKARGKWVPNDPQK